MKLARGLLLSALLLPLSLLADVDPSLFQELHWRSIGPFRGGRVLAVSGVPNEPEHFYFGSVNGGVWESRDAGRTWMPIFDGQPIGSIGAVAVAPSNPRVIYVGSGEADMRSDIAQGNGMYRSSDGGKTWSHIGLEDTQQIAQVIVHPTNAEVAYVAALGHPYGPNAERGLFRTRDGGRTWQRILSRNNDSDTGAVDVTFEPGNPNVLYAALWQTRRTPWSVYPPSTGPGGGLFKSTDGGDTWTELKSGLPPKTGRIGITISAANPRRVYAIVDADQGGMYRSDDAGATWTRVGTDARIWSRGWYFGGITANPKNADVVYSCNVNLYETTDAGKTWVPVKGAPGGDDYHTLWIDPQEPARRILGVDQGAVVTLNGGRTWSSWFNQATGQFYHVITDDRFPYRVYGAQQDSGSATVPSRTNEVDGINMTNFREITAGGESDNVAPDPKNPDIIFGGRVERLDISTHQTQSVDPTLAYPGNDRRTWTLPLVFSRRDPRVLYFANQKMYRTEDGGNHWTVISPDLTREAPGIPPNLDPATAALSTGPRPGVIYAIAPSRVADRDLWAGTDDGQTWRTRDEGAHWTNVTPPALTAWSKVGIIDASPFDAETAYAAVDRHRLDDFRPYIYRTHDGGRSWQLVAAGIPNGSFVNVVREDAVRKGLLYAGTERGMYVSFDDGDHWQSLQQNLPVTSVRDIDVHGNDVVIGTHGRAFWIMDDVTPLRQNVAAGSGAFLFKPATAIRERVSGFTGTPMPKDEPMAPNPPAGAYVDYVLRTPATQPVMLEIYDATNTLVRRYSSADAPPALDPAKLRTSAEWFATPSTLQTTPGMHRFVWPLQYPSRIGNGPYANGVWATPGEYRLVLLVDGQRSAQSLTIAPHPRIAMTQAQYEEQFAFAREVEQTWGLVRAAHEEAQSLVPKLQGEQAARAAAIAELNLTDAWWLQPKTTTSLRFLDTALEKLFGAVDGADTPVTTDARESWKKLRPVAESALKSWTEFRATVK
jgi:photosystem II stability/assembly factor-like uncharacterized protein